VSDDFLESLATAAARSETYGRLAEAFLYPRNGNNGVLTGVEYTAAFDRSANENACSLRGYAYAPEVHSTALYEELLRFYQFFGLSRAPNADMPDHISVELQFMQFLSSLEANALDRGESPEPIHRAQQDFLIRHLSVLAGGVREKLRSDSAACKMLVDLCWDVVSYDLARLQQILSYRIA
jgi:DMSO reductase family type II enzyme chaperone